LEIAIFSFLPDGGIESYRSYGQGGATGNSTLGHPVTDNGRTFEVSVETGLKAHRFHAIVTVTPREVDQKTKPLTREFDLSVMEPQSLDLARDEDGRIYRINLMPRVQQEAPPRQFNARHLHMEAWSFPSSPIILDDQVYLGTLSMSYGSFAHFEVPGLARIEFSLLHLKDAKPWGVLDDGTLRITHEDGTTFRITNVKNGVHSQELPGGPYQVWVRWKEPSQTLEEYQEIMKSQLADLKSRVENGDVLISADQVRRLEQSIDSGRVHQMASGLRPVRVDELAWPDE
jgi:hypothetical protein